MLKSNNLLSPNSLDDENNNYEDLVNYDSQLLSPSHINHHNHRKNYDSFLSSTKSFCLECDLQKLINDKNIYNKDLNLKAKENKQINNLILTGNILLQKNKLNEAYNILSSAVKAGIIYPDLFYLYGEICRKLKYMEDAEKYLLICLDYKNCSPYVYLSLAQLYKEIGQIKFSKNFYKKCLLHFNKASIHYNLGINYIKLNKPLKAINYFTEAIKLEPNQPLFYKKRADVYKSLGHNDLYLKDMYNYNIHSHKN
jgi:tetratricopeptide (TPR) repeat protein